ncbi:MAG: hypothetical protein MRJ68_09340 [Nitrospira sp.]|nr:hypothetical protein [Nitrospira sp.]
MNCTRCQGLMLKEQMIDLEGSYGEMWISSWRCFNCGHRDDAVLQQHRRQYAQPVAGSPQSVKAQEAEETIDWSWDEESVEPLAA